MNTFLINVSKQLTKHSPTILTALASAGLVSTAVLAVKSTPKALDIIQDWEVTNKEIADTKQMFKLCWKEYIPSAVIGGISIGCIIFANRINLRRAAAIASVYSVSEAALKEYKDKVITEFGKNKAQKIKDEILKDKIIKNPVKDNEIIITGKGDTKCYDALAGRYFKGDIEYIKRSLNELSMELINNDFVSLNDLYYKLNMRGTKLGDLVGWFVSDGKIIEGDFSSCLDEDGVPCLVLDFYTEPRYNYNDY